MPADDPADLLAARGAVPGVGGVRPAALDMLASGDTPRAWSWSASSRAQALRSVKSWSSSACRACVSGTLRRACLTSRIASMTSLSTWLRAAAGSSRGGGLTRIPMRAGRPRHAPGRGYWVTPSHARDLLIPDQGSPRRSGRMESASSSGQGSRDRAYRGRRPRPRFPRPGHRSLPAWRHPVRSLVPRAVPPDRAPRAAGRRVLTAPLRLPGAAALSSPGNRGMAGTARAWHRQPARL